MPDLMGATFFPPLKEHLLLFDQIACATVNMPISDDQAAEMQMLVQRGIVVHHDLSIPVSGTLNVEASTARAKAVKDAQSVLSVAEKISDEGVDREVAYIVKARERFPDGHA